MSSKLTQLAREPLVQFFLMGACIYVAYAWLGAPDEDAADRTIVVDTARIESFIGGWQQRFGRPPTAQELDGLIRQFVREDILYREAVAMGLGEDDAITRRRMAQKLEFLTKDIARLKEPAIGELVRYFEDNEELYRPPDLITFSHVFLDPDERGETTLDDAAELLVQLQAAGEPDAEAPSAGDRFMLQSYYPRKSELDIRRQFGSGFSAAVMQLEPDRWHGPVLSGYGTHLVYVHALEVASPAQFEDVRDDVFENWQGAQQEKINAQYFESLKSRYEIVIEKPSSEAAGARQADARVASEPAS